MGADANSTHAVQASRATSSALRGHSAERLRSRRSKPWRCWSRWESIPRPAGLRRTTAKFVHHLSTSFVLAYHGCDRDLGESLLSGSKSFKPSNNDYDWLGPGVYFWESNPHRAMEFAREKLRRGSEIRRPFVVGAVLDLGLCLDLTTKDSIENLRDAHESFLGTIPPGGPLPVNGPENWRRRLDCAVIRCFHQILQATSSEPVDTVRGIFTEGRPIYAGSAFLEKTHVQIAVVNPECIKAVFRVSKT
jgi:hypothetical protein